MLKNVRDSIGQTPCSLDIILLKLWSISISTYLYFVEKVLAILLALEILSRLIPKLFVASILTHVIY